MSQNKQTKKSAEPIEESRTETIANIDPPTKVEALINEPGKEIEPQKSGETRRYWRDAILRSRSVSLLDKADTELFILINNHFPHTPAANTFFTNFRCGLPAAGPGRPGSFYPGRLPRNGRKRSSKKLVSQYG